MGIYLIRRRMEAETTLSYTNVGAASVEDNKVQVE
jgi:hypothetical protein